jgi:hypothetical protein
MNRDRRRVVGGFFADAAKYTLTAGVVGGFVSGGMTLLSGILLMLAFASFSIAAYFITPNDKED